MRSFAMSQPFAWSLIAALATTCVASAQTTTQERGADGQLYNVTRTTVPKTVVTTQMQTREETVYQAQTNTQYQTYQQNVLTPVTEYRWVSRQRGWWNPFRQPYWTHAIEPVTRWENRAATVQMPVTTTNWVPQKRTTQVPVASYQTVQDTYVSRVPVGPAPAFRSSPSAVAAQPAPTAPAKVASRPTTGPIGGQRLDQPAQWTGGTRYR